MSSIMIMYCRVYIQMQMVSRPGARLQLPPSKQATLAWEPECPTPYSLMYPASSFPFPASCASGKGCPLSSRAGPEFPVRWQLDLYPSGAPWSAQFGFLPGRPRKAGPGGGPRSLARPLSAQHGFRGPRSPPYRRPVVGPGSALPAAALPAGRSVSEPGGRVPAGRPGRAAAGRRFRGLRPLRGACSPASARPCGRWSSSRSFGAATRPLGQPKGGSRSRSRRLQARPGKGRTGPLLPSARDPGRRQASYNPGVSPGRVPPSGCGFIVEALACTPALPGRRLLR